MDESKTVEKVHELTDIELAILLSLVANQHCMIETADEALLALEDELRLVSQNVFGLTHALIHCDENTSLEDISNGVLVDRISREDAEIIENENSRHFPSSGYEDKAGLPSQERSSHVLPNTQDTKAIAEMVILTGLSSSSDHVQIQALELLRTRRIFTHTAIYTAPKTFLIVFVKSTTDSPLVHHLNDHIFISHYHDIEEGFANLEESSEWIEDDQVSLSSVVHRSMSSQAAFKKNPPFFPQDEVQALSKLRDQVTFSAEIRAYLQNIVIFLRLHRAVGGGISPLATKHFELLARCLPPLHSLNFVPPSLVSLAARKVYLHRIAITSAIDERSIQYGSDLSAVSALLEGVTPEIVIDEVLQRVEIPL